MPQAYHTTHGQLQHFGTTSAVHKSATAIYLQCANQQWQYICISETIIGNISAVHKSALAVHSQQPAPNLTTGYLGPVTAGELCVHVAAAIFQCPHSLSHKCHPPLSSSMYLSVGVASPRTAVKQHNTSNMWLQSLRSVSDLRFSNNTWKSVTRALMPLVKHLKSITLSRDTTMVDNVDMFCSLHISFDSTSSTA